MATTDHTESPSCCCDWRLYAKCAAEYQRREYESDLRAWLETYGVRERKAERREPVLRLVR